METFLDFTAVKSYLTTKVLTCGCAVLLNQKSNRLQRFRFRKLFQSPTKLSKNSNRPTAQITFMSRQLFLLLKLQSRKLKTH